MRRFPALVLLVLLLPIAVVAQQPRPSARAALGQPAFPSAQDRGLPQDRAMSEAVRRVERETRGQVLNVESIRFQGREVHRVKVLEPGGRIRVVVDDPGHRPGPPAEPAFRSTRGDDNPKPTL